MSEDKEIEKQEDDEISLIDLFAVLLRYKFFIIITTALAIIGVLIFCILSIKLPVEKSPMPNKYTATAQMLITEEQAGSSASSILNASGLGSLAGMMGVSVPTSASNVGLIQYLLSSNYILDQISDKFNYKERLGGKKDDKKDNDDKKEIKISTIRNAIKGNLSSNMDEESGVFSISFTNTDPVFAKDVVNYTVELIDKRFTEFNVDQNRLAKANIEENINNALATIDSLQSQINELESAVSNIYNPYAAPSVMKESGMLKLELDAQKEIYKQLKAQEELLKVDLASEKPAFQVLEYAEVPDTKSGPSRGKICIIVTFAAFFLSILMAFLLNAIKNVRKDPVAMAKLKGKK